MFTQIFPSLPHVGWSPTPFWLRIVPFWLRVVPFGCKGSFFLGGSLSGIGTWAFLGSRDILRVLLQAGGGIVGRRPCRTPGGRRTNFPTCRFVQHAYSWWGGVRIASGGKRGQKNRLQWSTDAYFFSLPVIQSVYFFTPPLPREMAF